MVSQLHFFIDSGVCDCATLTFQHQVSQANLYSCRLWPSNVCLSLWPQFEKKVLENGDREILRESLKARLREIESNVIWHTNTRQHNNLNSI